MWLACKIHDLTHALSHMQRMLQRSTSHLAVHTNTWVQVTAVHRLMLFAPKAAKFNHSKSERMHRCCMLSSGNGWEGFLKHWAWEARSTMPTVLACNQAHKVQPAA